MSKQFGVSIIVVNFNYGRFLTAAIDSALDQDHPLCEVIVVDDCSTDNSRIVIDRYGDRIRPVLRIKNGGEVAAMNSAWPLARHPVVIFLDADDVLFRRAASTVAAHWTQNTVKAQFPLATIDEAGREVGHVTPRFSSKLETARIRAGLLATGQSESAPGSGNAYSRSLLVRLAAEGGFAVENPREHHMDSILEINAPFYGEVVTIHEPLACRRIHHSNMYALDTLDRARFAMMLDTFIVKLEYLATRCQAWGISFDLCAARNRSPWLLECRLIVSKLAPANDPSREPIRNILYQGLKAYFDEGALVPARVVPALWFLGVALSPRYLATQLIALRFIVTRRPLWFQWLFAVIAKTRTFGRRGSPCRREP